MTCKLKSTQNRGLRPEMFDTIGRWAAQYYGDGTLAVWRAFFPNMREAGMGVFIALFFASWAGWMIVWYVSARRAHDPLDNMWFAIGFNSLKGAFTSLLGPFWTVVLWLVFPFIAFALAIRLLIAVANALLLLARTPSHK